MNHNFDFQGCQKMHIRVAISQKGLIGLFANCCHLMLLGPKEWKHKSKVLRTHFKNFFIPGTLWREAEAFTILVYYVARVEGSFYEKLRNNAEL